MRSNLITRSAGPNGNALLPAALFDDIDGSCELELRIGGSTHYRLAEEPGRALRAG